MHLPHVPSMGVNQPDISRPAAHCTAYPSETPSTVGHVSSQSHMDVPSQLTAAGKGGEWLVDAQATPRLHSQLSFCWNS